MSLRVLYLMSLLMLLSSCGGRPVRGANSPEDAPEGPVALTVFAAASLTDVFSEIGQSFEADNPNVSVAFNFAGSQQLAQQLLQGAPADMFATANTVQMDVVIEGGRISDGQAQIFAQNRLVVIYPADNPAGLSNLQDLAKPEIRLVLAAKEVPVGRYSLEFLDKAGREAVFGAAFREAALDNIVSYEQNVRAVLTKVALGEGDAGLVYTSDVSGSRAGQVGRIDIPTELNTTAVYPLAPLDDAAHPDLAAAFAAYVLSPAGQAILADYGFTPGD